MFNIINESKIAHFSKILMGFSLASYLILFLVGSVLHNHSVVILPHFQYSHEQAFSHQDCHDHGGSGEHREDHHNCPICQFKLTAAGVLLAVLIILFYTPLIIFQIFSEHQNYYLPQKYLCIYLRAPPIPAA